MAGEIKPGETLNIGHESSGVPPFSFVIPDGLSEDRMYVKVILTTSPADFNMLTLPHNPLEAPSVLDTSNTARGEDRLYNRSAAVKYIQTRQGPIKEDTLYYSVILTVRQIPDLSTSRSSRGSGLYKWHREKGMAALASLAALGLEEHPVNLLSNEVTK